MTPLTQVPLTTLLKMLNNIENKQKELEENKSMVISELDERRSYFLNIKHDLIYGEIDRRFPDMLSKPKEFKKEK